MTCVIRDQKDVANTINAMTYCGLRDLAKVLVDMNADGERDVKTVEGMAETLVDWAQSVIDDYQ